jgi:hypothetical protein
MQIVYLCRAIKSASDIARTHNAIDATMCSIVANIIASADYGSSQQADLMRHAEEWGFTVGYFGSIIQVEWNNQE